MYKCYNCDVEHTMITDSTPVLGSANSHFVRCSVICVFTIFIDLHDL